MRILPILMSNSLCENDVKEKWKVEAVGLIFHVVSKNVVVFYATPWESAALTNLFSRSQKLTFWK